MQHEWQGDDRAKSLTRPSGSSAWRQLALSVIGATAILVFVRVASETDWSSDMVARLLQSSIISGLVGFSLLFGVQLILSSKARSRLLLGVSFVIAILAGVAIVTAVVPTLNWLMGSMIAPNAPGESRSDFTGFLAEYFLAVYWRLVVIMGPLFVAFNWRWFEARLGPLPVRQEARNSPVTNAASTEGQAEAYDPSPMPEAEPTETAEEWLVNKLTMPKRGALWAVSSELHYIRIYTDVANDLVLMRLSDAVEQLAESDGIQIHRSHWVARAGIRDLVRKDGGFEVELHNGVRLPVSRSNAASVKAFFKTAQGA